MSGFRKSLRDIGTLSGRVDRVSLPYRAFLKISCLEMEKVRRHRERASASKTIDRIDARLKEIEGEKAALLRTMEEMGQGPEPVRSGPSNPGRPGGMKIKY
jgi:hypothetical protein